VRRIGDLCADLGIAVIAEGVETADECRCLIDLGVHLLQGYHFGKPLSEACARRESVTWPDTRPAATPD
jgi:EAL domain-containing protein (putative c-di-GMP-specific phosphodiesterase class I)